MTDGGTHQRGVTNWIGLANLLAVVGLGVMVWEIHTLSTRVDAWMEHERMDPQQGQPVDVFEYSYKSGGGTQVVRTYKPTKGAEETEAQLLARWAASHRAAVDASLVTFPKDP